jgi:hypothetical protein
MRKAEAAVLRAGPAGRTAEGGERWSACMERRWSDVRSSCVVRRPCYRQGGLRRAFSRKSRRRLDQLFPALLPLIPGHLFLPEVRES